MALRSRIYPHNDLLNLSHYNLGVINEKVENGVSDAIALDCKNFLIALAFTIEALMNLVGSKKVRGWKEHDCYYKKMKKMCKAIGYPYNNESDLFCTLEKIKNIRNGLAHGKPIERTIIVSNREERNFVLNCEWDNYTNPEFCNNAYKKVKEFRDDIFKAAGISISETLTGTFGTLS